jgi:hypothetical protein
LDLEVQMAMDVVPMFYRHLDGLGAGSEDTHIDLFIHSNGGDGTVPWRLVSLLRERCKRLSVLVPHLAYSAATLLALGADEVIMHPMGTLGPIDPTVTTPFNPPHPQNPNQLLGISVEDVAAYIALVKEDVGIRHEDELVQAFRVLAESVSPLALGNVKRSTSQSQMMGNKLLRQRADGDPMLGDHEIHEIIKTLTSELYYHGHPINRVEARRDLGLTFVNDATPEVEAAMWDLYEAYATEMRLEERFSPIQEAYAIDPLDLPQHGTAAPGGNVVPIKGMPNEVKHVVLPPVNAAFIESSARTDRLSIEFEITLMRDLTGAVNANVFQRSTAWELETGGVGSVEEVVEVEEP